MHLQKRLYRSLGTAVVDYSEQPFLSFSRGDTVQCQTRFAPHPTASSAIARLFPSVSCLTEDLGILFDEMPMGPKRR